MSDEMFTKLAGIEDSADVNVATNLALTVDGTSFKITSSTGDDVSLTAATETHWGILSSGAQTIGGAKTFTSDISGNVTTATNLAGNQVMNKIYSGPSSGDDAAPSFRSLVSDDIPTNLPNLTAIGTTSVNTTFSGPILANEGITVAGSQTISMGSNRVTNLSLIHI